jgi:3-hydroxyisobutyrate dehydrogenase
MAAEEGKSMSVSPVRTIAFIGVGLMGSPMARHLLSAGFTLRVWNRTRSKLDSLLAAGAAAAGSPVEAADGADVLCLCVTDRLAVEAVLLGTEGVVNAKRPPPIVVDFSTIGPDATIELAARVRAQCGASWVDAPVSGGATGAEQRKLVIFCGGSEADIERLAVVFQAISQRHRRIGELGAGQTLKLCNQLIVATNLVAIAESFALARASGLDLAILPEALAGGFADSIPLQIFGRRMAQGVYSPILGELALMLKDLSAVDDLARRHETELPMTSAALEIYRRARDLGKLHEDLAAVFSLYPKPGC